MNSTLQKIIDAKDTAQKKVFIKEWGVELLIIEPVRKVVTELRQRYAADIDVKGLSPEEAAKKATDSMGISKAEEFALACVAVMVHDLDGNLVFESIEKAQEILDKKSSRVQIQLIEECQILISPPTVDEVKAAEGN